MAKPPAACRPPAMDVDERAIRLDVKQHFQRWDREVGLELFSKIRAAGGFAEHLDNDDRPILEAVRCRVRNANHHGVRVVKAGLVGELDPDLRVAIEGLAGFAAELPKEKAERVHGDGVMPVRRTSHRMHDPAEILMLHIAGFLSVEVVFDRNRVTFGEGGHLMRLPDSPDGGKSRFGVLTHRPGTR